ncbi:uncharacterized protein BO88DRAFT_407445 [Aspergillus vadensis CBS 113365]|uniref:Uncharacterized protein n=1 Tax=Aspergillus vadensis (strain CBS 113365 / IMI 142717 / IBT 24658) TaxID=1448311 RepID=A0A319B5Y9_ASPVC|nr:hypothetical protein BO88DRAFT_407445 [Aspergillus vadensis CBS 113365]PYH65690.1 hypothetical protein BO88DRAFT_407445 [Aspergillus vadensis CBS 113365]
MFLGSGNEPARISIRSRPLNYLHPTISSQFNRYCSVYTDDFRLEKFPLQCGV